MTNKTPTPTTVEPAQHPHQCNSADAGLPAQHVADPTVRHSGDSDGEQPRRAIAETPPAEGTPKGSTKKKGGKKPAGPRTAPAAGEGGTKMSKTEAALKLLRRKNGAALPELQEATGWQAHSVRGFLSGTVKKKLGLSLTSEVGKQGVRRYRIVTAADAG